MKKQKSFTIESKFAPPSTISILDDGKNHTGINNFEINPEGKLVNTEKPASPKSEPTKPTKKKKAKNVKP